MLSVNDRYNLTCELNPKFGAISSFHNMYISTPLLANQCFPSALQLRKTKLRNRPTDTKNTEIIGDVKKSIVCDSGEIISTVSEVFSGRVVVERAAGARDGDETRRRRSTTTRPENISLTVETDRSPPRYTMYYFMAGKSTDVFVE